MKRLLLLLILLAAFHPIPTHAQVVQVTGSLTASSTACATSGSCVTFSVPVNTGSVGFIVSNNGGGNTLQFEESVDGVNFVSVSSFPPSSTTGVTSTTSNGSWTASVASMTTFRIRCSTYVSGTVSISISSSAALSASSLTSGSGGGSGTVTSIATTSPITGGTITTTGTIACGTCVAASSPGAGVAHFAGSTQTVTSSAVTPSDASGNTSGSGNFALVTSPTFVTPVLGAATGTSLLVTGIIDGLAPVTITTGSTASLGGTYNSGYTYNQEGTAGTAVTYTLPTAAAGKQYCIGNSYNGSAGETGILTLQTSATGQFLIYNGVLSATDGHMTSGGALGDAGCAVGTDATHWTFYAQYGTWVVH